CLQSKVSYNF
nr:immunoglobulin light chain junction region [Macaca mulatta]